LIVCESRRTSFSVTAGLEDELEEEDGDTKGDGDDDNNKDVGVREEEEIIICGRLIVRLFRDGGDCCCRCNGCCAIHQLAKDFNAESMLGCSFSNCDWLRINEDDDDDDDDLGLAVFVRFVSTTEASNCTHRLVERCGFEDDEDVVVDSVATAAFFMVICSH